MDLPSRRSLEAALPGRACPRPAKALVPAGRARTVYLQTDSKAARAKSARRAPPLP
jgi:hypothetical protein